MLSISTLRVMNIALVLLFCSALFEAVACASGGESTFLTRYVYDSSVIYPGKYGAKLLYYHNPKNPNWQQGFRKDLGALTCGPAYGSFVKYGIWKGHLNQNGSCGDLAEPVDWAVGNYLNFDSNK